MTYMDNKNETSEPPNVPELALKSESGQRRRCHNDWKNRQKKRDKMTHHRIWLWHILQNIGI